MLNRFPRFAYSCSLLFCILAIGSMPAASIADDFAKSEQALDTRLEKALKELATVRNEIAKGKIPLSKQIAQLEKQVVSLRKKQQELLKARDSRTIDLSTLRAQVASLAEQEKFIGSRLEEYVRGFESRLDISELPLYQNLTSAALLSKMNVNLDAEQKRGAQLDVVDAGLERVGLQLGGRLYAGDALSPDGLLTSGTFISVGPTVFYASEDGEVTGLVENQLNAADPVVVDLPSNTVAGILAVASGGQGRLPFDATLGKALKKRKARKSMGQYIADGGMVGYVILLLGAAAFGLTALKIVEIARLEIAPPDDVDAVLAELATGSRDAAAKRAHQVKGIVGEMLSVGVSHVGQGGALLEEMLFEKILGVRPILERYLPFLAITAAAAPLLGLLGTVIGMIKTFQLITIFGTGDAKSLSSGISEALVTTALGLIVAIPVLIVHGALTRQAKKKVGLLEQMSVAFVNGVETLRTRTVD